MNDQDQIDQVKTHTVYKYWGAFYAKVDSWIQDSALNRITKDTENISEIIQEHTRQRLEAIRTHISATHVWIPGRDHWQNGNMYQSPLECKVCGMGAGEYDDDDCERTKLLPGQAPTKDMHNSHISRTCAEVQAARQRARKHRKGGKCGQCRTYECIHFEIRNT